MRRSDMRMRDEGRSAAPERRGRGWGERGEQVGR